MISLTRQNRHRNSGFKEEADESTCGYFEFGTLMSPRFLFLVFRNLKTKLLGFGIESNLSANTISQQLTTTKKKGTHDSKALHGNSTPEQSEFVSL